MRLVFAGTPAAAVPSLLRLNESDHEVVAVVTRPDARSGRGQQSKQSAIAQISTELNLPTLQPASPRDPGFVRDLIALEPDCCPIVAYGGLIPAELLTLPTYGWVNLHFSLLPTWRGAAPVQHALLNGDEQTGATTFLLDEGLDTGPVFGATVEPIGRRDTSGQLLERLARSGAELLVRTMDAIADGTARAEAQPSDGVSLAPKLSSDDARIAWRHPALAIDRRIRACAPVPGAWTTVNGERLKLSPVELVPETADLAPAQLLLGKREVLVGTGSHAVRLGEVQPQGRRPMPATDWARGLRDAEPESFE